ncbi:unnamed protein product [Microthlaspi erraticum]|uniref:TIR domain-containing protein n=1 Tax=Microthlaspi erraticum TaxID=1685480 RepID=A0A6D2J033_9BRAS|nr:unnamed protein product [Microthlaspi erraticum]
MAPSSSSYSRNWVYDVFPSFSGKDVRVAFLSHFHKELDRKLITVFRDDQIERSRSLSPELVQAIKDSRISVVVFSKNYASSSWCLNELLEIVKCKKELGQACDSYFLRFGSFPREEADRKLRQDLQKDLQEQNRGQKATMAPSVD